MDNGYVAAGTSRSASACGEKKQLSRDIRLATCCGWSRKAGHSRCPPLFQCVGGLIV